MERRHDEVPQTHQCGIRAGLELNQVLPLSVPRDRGRLKGALRRIAYGAVQSELRQGILAFYFSPAPDVMQCDQRRLRQSNRASRAR